MSLSNLTPVERKVLGALLVASDNNLIADVSLNDIARTIGYAKSGGIISAAIRALELQNIIVRDEYNGYKILI